MAVVITIVVMIVLISIDAIVNWANPFGFFWLWSLVEITVLLIIPFLSDELSWGSKWNEGLWLYFIVQISGTFMITASIFLGFETIAYNFKGLFSAVFCMSGFSLKLGLFPFHFWVRRSFAKFNYIGIFLAGAVCKANIISASSTFDYAMWCYSYIYASSLISILYASVIIVFSVEVKTLLSYSSLWSTGFINLCNVIDCLHLMFVYSFLYSGLILMIAYILSKGNCYYVNNLSVDIPANYKPGFFFSAFSLSGFPLSLNFCAKMSVVRVFSDVALNNDTLMIILVLALSSVGTFITWTLISLYAIPFSFRGNFREFWTLENFYTVVCVVWSVASGPVIMILLDAGILYHV